MRILLSLFLGLFLTVLTSCTAMQSLFKREQKTYQQPSSKNHSTPASTLNKGELQTTQQADSTAESEMPEPETATSDSVTPPLLQKPKPSPAGATIQFSTVESANVRIPLNLNNPFPESGKMELELDALSGDFCYPYPGKLISPFGYRGRSMHSGIDIKAIPNDTIRAAFSGVVRMAKVYSGYGNTIVIRHTDGFETLYSHQARNLVDVNQYVQAGEAIGLAGRTGRATTEHLHFELRVANQAMNPSLLVDPAERTLQRGTLYFYKRGDQITATTRPEGKGDGVEMPKATLAERNAESVTGSSASSATASSSTSSAAPSKNESAPEASPKVAAKTTKTTTSSSSSAPTKRYHTIKSGDTLSVLAKRYGTTVAKICALNNIKPTKVLQIKQRLRVK